MHNIRTWITLAALNVAGFSAAQCKYTLLQRDEFSGEERVTVDVGMFIGDFGLYPTFRRVGDQHYISLRLAGYIARGVSVPEGATALIKLANDTVLTIVSTRTQIFEANYYAGASSYSISPQYRASARDLVMLATQPVVRIRFHFSDTYHDIDFTGKAKQQEKVLRGASCFINAQVP